MYKIQTLNKISPLGLEKFSREHYETASEITRPDAILLRSADMHTLELPNSLLAVGRAGAGVNNIPVAKCTERGIVVFNTPGANANAVKELAVMGLLLSSRKIVEGIQFAKTLVGKGEAVPELIEKGKGQFTGPEIYGKKLGVIGLGAVGVMVANSAVGLGMTVEGYDPFISIDAAWNLSRDVIRAKGIERLIATSDYISLHIPETPTTRGFINAEKFARMKKGVRIMNLSREGIVVEKDLLAALAQGVVACFVTDFGNETLLKTPNVICFPHLGASTPEAEENCAVMIAEQMRDFLEHGNVHNAVNFPSCYLDPSDGARVTVINRNVPNMVGQFSTALAQAGINIGKLINNSRGDVAYNILDVTGDVTDDVLAQVAKIEGVVRVRKIG